MNEHMILFKHVLQDIEAGYKVVFTNHYWYEQFVKPIEDEYCQRFTWKQGWIQQPLEGTATYIDIGQVVVENECQDF